MPKIVLPGSTDPGVTAQEAAAREIEWKCRGHVAHEHVFLAKIVERIRALPAQPTVEGALLAAARAAYNMKDGRTQDEKRLCDEAVNRILFISPADPMEPFSDKCNWWPRATEQAA